MTGDRHDERGVAIPSGWDQVVRPTKKRRGIEKAERKGERNCVVENEREER